ncbi:MAG TPA: 2-oxoacid:acceptor oxidoreductase subunit alpha [bacterium]|nr:2-oxoacid:acceptor oxidoreductase subunit alpha [bacterium]
MTAVNDFVVRFANVNGSGSASANRLFARAVLRMGVPVSPRNIFPSNIEGLPTWFEVRVSGEGHLGRRGGYDLLVAMNPQTWAEDVAGLEPGGYLLHDSSKPLERAAVRDDITLLGVPLTEMCNREYTDPRQRQLFRNIMYVGALSALLDMDVSEIERLLGEQFGGKPRLVAPNVRALHLGRDYALAHLPCPIGFRIQRGAGLGDRVFIEGNSAAGLGCVYGGATVAAWYPITPSSGLAEAFARHCRRYRVDPATGKHRYAIVQAEDELSSIGMVIGAAWNGARAFTATSGPGISLMQEFLGLAYFAEIPAVIFDVQRAGPSTGMPTRTQQGDILACAYASHGDTKHVLLIPEDPREAFEFAALSFDLADRLQTPVFVLLDLDIGMNEWLCAPLAWDDARRMDRGKVLTAEALDAGAKFGRYLDVDGDGIPYRTYPGTHPTRGAFFSRGTTKDRYARYTEDGQTYVDNMERLMQKFETAKGLVPAPLVQSAPRPARTGVIYYGSTAPALREALAMLERQGIVLDALRVRAFPFAAAVAEFITGHDRVFIVEQNRDAQLRTLIVNECGIDPSRLVPVLHYDGTPITATFIARAIAAQTEAAVAAREAVAR